MNQDRYLRNRPFLTVSVIQRAAPHVNTSKRGWQKEEGAMQTFEQVGFVDRINNNRGQFAVIIDIINSAVIQNSSNLSDNEVMANYLSKYRDQVTQSLTIWAQREAAKAVAEETVEAVSE